MDKASRFEIIGKILIKKGLNDNVVAVNYKGLPFFRLPCWKENGG